MAAPDLSRRTTVFIAKIGTDDSGYNVVGAPQPRLTIAQALADLVSGYDAATPTAPKVLALEPGTYTTPAFALPPNVFIEADPDAQGGSNAQVIISLQGNITLSSGWTANTTAVGGFRGVTIRQTTSQNLDFTMPVPSAGSPTRRITLEDVRTDVDNLVFQATGSGDRISLKEVVQDGTSSQLCHFSGGTHTINNLQTNAPITFDDTGGIAASIQAYGLFLTATPSATTPGVTFNSTVAGVLARMGGCDNRSLTLNRAGAGTLTVYADAISIPLVANITYAGTATTANLIRTTDMGGLSPTGGGATGTLAFSNAAGNTTVSPSAHVWTAQGTFTGAAGTRIVILDITGSTLTAGDTISLFVTRTDGAGIVIPVRNATSGGTLLATVPDNTGSSTAKIDLVYGTIATGYAANAWVAQSFQIPATT